MELKEEGNSLQTRWGEKQTFAEKEYTLKSEIV